MEKQFQKFKVFEPFYKQKRINELLKEFSQKMRTKCILKSTSGRVLRTYLELRAEKNLFRNQEKKY